jgi:hypothetical protein
MATETQQHLLVDGTLIEISRDGRHQYWVGDGPKMKGVTSLIGHVDADGFGAGMGWALKKVRENGGDLEAPRQSAQQAKETGARLHSDIDDHIKTGTIAEDPLFLAWYRGQKTDANWLGSERFVINPELEYGGTVDALELLDHGVVIHDWKTVEPSSWHKYGDTLRKNKDAAQLAAYARALERMNSRPKLQARGPQLVPTRGFVTYVLRDGSESFMVEADLELGWKIFQASRELTLLMNGNHGASMKRPSQEAPTSREDE